MIISDGYNGTPAGFENVCEDDNGVTKPYRATRRSECYHQNSTKQQQQ